MVTRAPAPRGLDVQRCAGTAIDCQGTKRNSASNQAVGSVAQSAGLGTRGWLESERLFRSVEVVLHKHFSRCRVAVRGRIRLNLEGFPLPKFAGVRAKAIEVEQPAMCSHSYEQDATWTGHGRSRTIYMLARGGGPSGLRRADAPGCHGDRGNVLQAVRHTKEFTYQETGTWSGSALPRPENKADGPPSHERASCLFSSPNSR